MLMTAHGEAPAGIEARPLETMDQLVEAGRVLAAYWGGDDGGMPPNLLRALAHTGNYVVGLYDGDRMVGASAAFFAEPAARSMHSHVTAVLPEHRARGLGRVLKEHQRQWALARSVGRITWTFDPLVARNAHFNLAVLGATVTEYLVDHYGQMADAANSGDETDRLFVTWAVAAARPRDPEPAEVVASVAVPGDIEAIRRTAPSDAVRWRREVRERFLELGARGLVVRGFDRERGYLFTAPPSRPPHGRA
ncbi:hypothetical protein AOA12_18510 [Microbacterium sp. No. 7]|nr:hypothetical protein AOA12_18510 [Microbacterium sp. No. 7]